MSRWGLWALLVVSLLFALLGVAMIVSGAKDGWLSFLFFGFCAAVAVVQLWPRLLQREPVSPKTLLARFPGPIVLRIGRARILYLLGAAFALSGSSAWLLYDKRSDGLLWVVLGSGVLLFGAAIPIFLLMLFKGSSLHLQAEDFRMAHLWRRSAVRWADVGAFGTATITGQTLVTFDAATVAGTMLARLNTGLVGQNSALPDSYGLAPEDLAWLLNGWRAKALGEAGDPP